MSIEEQCECKNNKPGSGVKVDGNGFCLECGGNPKFILTDCEHKWEFLQTLWEYPVDYSCTTALTEYAYFTCHKCLEMSKREIKILNNKKEE